MHSSCFKCFKAFNKFILRKYFHAPEWIHNIWFLSSQQYSSCWKSQLLTFFSHLIKPQKLVYTQKTQLSVEWKKTVDFYQPTFSWSKIPGHMTLQKVPFWQKKLSQNQCCTHGWKTALPPEQMHCRNNFMVKYCKASSALLDSISGDITLSPQHPFGQFS